MIGDDERRALRDGIEAYASDRGVAVAEALWASVERPGALPRDGLLAVLSDELVFAPAGDPAGREPWRWRLPPVAALSPQPSLSGARATVDIDGEQLTVELPGGDEDLAALRAALAEAGPTVADAPYRAGGFEDTAEVPEDFEVLWDVHDDEPSDIGPPSDVWEEPERADLVPAAPGGVEAPASRSMLVIAAVAAAGGVVTLVLVTWLLSAAGPASAPQAGGAAPAAVEAVATDPVPDPVLQPRAPRGLKGLRFGMTLAESTTELPALAAADELPFAVVKPGLSFDDPVRSLSVADEAAERVPGIRRGLDTTIGDYPARCELAFAVDDTLSRMRCVLEPLASQAAHEAAEQAVVGSLRGRYGEPARAPSADDAVFEEIAGFVVRDRRWAWYDTQASLQLTSSYHSLTEHSEIALDNSSSAHDVLIEHLSSLAEARRDEALARLRAEEEAEAVRERERNVSNARALDEDL